MSDDNEHAIVLIAFIGCVFSPSYFKARQHAPADPYEFCALNVALHGPNGKRWALTEYRASEHQFTHDTISLGRNQLLWDGERLRCTINEVAAPIPTPIRGEITLHPQVLTNTALPLDPVQLHWWQPIAPRARVEVELSRPKLRWSGTGYLDTNHGSAPLDAGMREWTWLRAHTPTGTKLIYDIQPVGGPPVVHALEVASSGNLLALRAPPRVDLPPTLWRLDRQTRADFGFRPKVVATLEDGPFYSRSVLDTRLGGQPVTAVHESLSLTRFRSAWVRSLLPFRMRRGSG